MLTLQNELRTVKSTIFEVGKIIFINDKIPKHHKKCLGILCIIGFYRL